MIERAFRADAREAKGLHDGTVGCLVRVVDPQALEADGYQYGHGKAELSDFWYPYSYPNGDGLAAQCDAAVRSPFGVVGDRLWVQETATPYPLASGQRYIYRADYTPGEPRHELKSWYKVCSMPRKACRTLLDVTDVRVVRAKDVTRADAAAIGVCGASFLGYQKTNWPEENFRVLWDLLHGDRDGEAWFQNPWLWLATVAKVEA